jgi:hypothetical protein
MHYSREFYEQTFKYYKISSKFKISQVFRLENDSLDEFCI